MQPSRSHRLHVVLRASLVVAILIGLLSSLALAAAPGDLDPAFGTSGYVITDIGNNNESANAVAVQADGNIIAAGYTGAAGHDFALVRHTSTGSPDSGFGTGGQVITPIGAGNSTVNAIALQGDGNIVVAGTSLSGTKTIFTIARYISSTGDLDATFGAGGIVTTSLSTGNDTARAVALQSDGKIVVAGDANSRFAAVRYTITGTLDMTFNGTGFVIKQVGAFDLAQAVLVQPDHKIVLAGHSDQGSSDDFAVVRYNANGSIDATFHTNGVVTTHFGGNLNDLAQAAALQPDGKMVLAGFTSSGVSDFALARYLPNGNLDATFGTAGLVTGTLGSNADEAHAVLVQPTAKIVAVGFSNQGGTQKNDFAVVRYLSNGTLDSSFGTNGMVLTDLQSHADDLAYAAALDANNNIVVAGSSDNSTVTGVDVAVARYLSPSQPPAVSDFAKNGIEDSMVTFTASDFTTHYNSPDNNNLSLVAITSLPVNGTLNLSTTAVSLNQEIPLAQVANLTYVPDQYFFGSDLLTWNGFDGMNYATVPATITLDIAFVNQAPSFVKGPNVAVFENTGPYTATPWATNVLPGPANEASQTLTFTLLTDHPGLFAIQPTITISGTDGALAFKPATSQFGTAIVTATLQDSGGTANSGVDTSAPQTFAITIKQYHVHLPIIIR